MIKTLYDPRIKKQAFKEGIEKGINEGVKKRSLEIAMRMLSDGMEPDKVAKFTELPMEEVHNLKLNKPHENI